MKDQEIIESIRTVIRDESRALEYAAAQVNEDYVQAVNLLLNCKGKIIVSGVGKSGHVARKIAATLSSTGSLAIFLHPTEAQHGDLGLVAGEDLVLAIGKSGESNELNQLIPAFRRLGTKLIAITATKNSTLGKNADVTLLCGVDKEACLYDLAPTSSTTAAMAIGDALAITLMKLKDFKPEDFALFHPGGKLGRRLLLRVCDVMIPAKDCPVLEASSCNFEDVIALLGSAGLGIVLFVKRGSSQLEGIMTDGDVRRILSREKGRIFERNVSEHMNRNPISLSSEILAVDALSAMESRSRPLNVVPVIDEQKLQGLIRLHELVKIG